MKIILHAAGLALAAVLLIGTGAGCLTVRPEGEKPADGLTDEDQGFGDALALYSQAFLLEQEEGVEKAIDYYQRSLDLNPDYERTYLRLALNHLKLKQSEQAVSIMETLCERHPDSFQACLWLARVYRETEQTEKAVQSLLRAIELDAGSLLPVLDLANIYRKEQQEEKAIALLREQIGLRDDSADLSRYLAGLYLARASRTGEESASILFREEAVAILLQAIKKQPDHLALRMALGDLYLQMDRVQDGVDQYEAIRRRDSEHLESLQKLALAYVALGDNLKAVDALEHLAENQAANGRVLLYLGELLERMGETGRAEKQYRRALLTQDEFKEIAAIRLALLFMNSEPDKAIALLRKTLEQLPGSVRLLEMLAYLHMNEKQHDQARAYFDQARSAMDKAAVSAGPSPQFSLYHALAVQRDGDIDTAVRYLLEAAEENPNYLGAYVQLVFSEEDEALERSSLGILDALEKRMPEELTIPMFRGLIQSQRKTYPEAVASFEQAEKNALRYEDGDDLLSARFYFWYAAACERDGQIDRATKLFERCLELDEKHAEAYNYLAYMWAERGENLDQGLAFIQKALKLEPDSGAYIDTLGWIFYRQGRPEAALEKIEKAAELIPDDATITDHLGDILLALDRRDEAVEAWEKAFVMDPELKGLADKLTDAGINLKPLQKKAEAYQAKLDAEKQKPLPESAAPAQP